MHLLDNPIWNSLRSVHSNLAIGNGQARRYPADIGPLSGIADQSEESYKALRALAGPHGTLAVFLEDPAQPQPGWTLVRTGNMTQMIFNGNEPPVSEPVLASGTLRALTYDDVDAMVALAELTEPGPFRRRTVSLGNFFGIFEAGRLLAMAGERMRCSGFIEVSAVCTHPDARGHGYAQILTARVVEDILCQNAVPFLHSLAENYGAIRVYERCGFIERRPLYLGVYRSND